MVNNTDTLATTLEWKHIEHNLLEPAMEQEWQQQISFLKTFILTPYENEGLNWYKEITLRTLTGRSAITSTQVHSAYH